MHRSKNGSVRIHSIREVMIALAVDRSLEDNDKNSRVVTVVKLESFRQRLIQNAKRLTDDAEVLWDNKRVDSALFLALAAMEEVSRIIHVTSWLAIREPESDEIVIPSKWWKSVVDGRAKNVHKMRLKVAKLGSLFVFPFLENPKRIDDEWLAHKLREISEKFVGINDLITRISHPDQMFICKNMVDDQVVTGISSG